METVLTPEVVGKLDTTLAQQLQEIVWDNAELLREITTLRERPKGNVSQISQLHDVHAS